MYYWKHYSEVGTISLATSLFYGLIYIAFAAIFYTILLLIAVGWGISQDDLSQDRYWITRTVKIIVFFTHFIV